MSIDPLQLGIPMMDAAQHSSAAEDIRRKDLREAAQQFESYMATLLIQEKRKTVPATQGEIFDTVFARFGGVAWFCSQTVGMFKRTVLGELGFA